MSQQRGGRLRTAIVVGFLLALGGTSSLSSTQAQRPAENRESSAPVLIARANPEDPGAPMEIGRVDIQATIAGFLARTTTTLTFENRTDRTLEGELVFPLPEGVTVSGYGLDVDGEIVDAVVVEAEAARVIFENEMRGRVDPGLVEWVRGNTFRTRVWPIPAQGRRTVRIQYVSALERRTEGLVYRLPLRYSLPIPDVTIGLEVLDPDARPTLHTNRLAHTGFSVRHDRLVASTQLKATAVSDDVRVSIPLREPHAAIVETHTDGRTYFAIDDVVDFAAPPAIARPRRVGLLWDASLSHATADVERELEVISAWLRSLNDVEVAMTVFRNVADPPLMLAVRQGDPGAIIGALKRAPRDGGTSFGALRSLPGVDYYLLVSDGFTNVGRDLPEGLGAPIYTLTGSGQADHSLLRRLARSTGGQHIPLSGLTSGEAAARIGRPAGGRISVHYDPARFEDVLPAAPEPIDGRIAIAGRLIAAEAPITIRYASASGGTIERRFMLRHAGAERSGLVPRFWAERKASELTAAPDTDRREWIALGKEFGIVTPGTSLLVLETLDQYLRHGIEPPESRAALRSEYLELIADRAPTETVTREAKLDRVADMWQQRIAWWNTVSKGPVAKKPGQPPSSPQWSRATPPRLAGQAARTVNCSGAPAAIQGRVADTTGSAIPGAAVTAINTITRVAVTANADVDGNYRLCQLPAGRYTIDVTLAGFQNWQGEVQLPATRNVDVTLEVGALTEAVMVSASPLVTTTQSMSMGSSVEASVSAEGPAIAIKAWDPATPYLAAMKKARPGKAYAAYLSERDRYAESPSFYLDAAGYLASAGEKALGVRVLTGILDLKLDDPRLLRIVAHRLQQLGERDMAIDLFEQVRRLRPEEPQSLRDLALALADRADAARGTGGTPAAIAADYLRSLDLLEQVVVGDWSERFPGIETMALIDANRLLAIMKREKLPGIERVTLDPRLRHRFDLDIRIILTWDTDQTDMDLWVTEPTGEKCDYSHNRTAIGAMMSPDFTNGYGPEEYLLRRAHAGKYTIQANFFGSRSQALTGPTTAQATVITDFGRPTERRRTLTLRLSEEKDVVDIGSVLFESRGTRRQ